MTILNIYSIGLTLILLIILIYLTGIKRSVYHKDSDYSKYRGKKELEFDKQRIIDLYLNQNIILPLDIIEEVDLNSFDSEDDIIDFIENQRYNWKQENNKKAFKR